MSPIKLTGVDAPLDVAALLARVDDDDLRDECRERGIFTGDDAHCDGDDDEPTFNEAALADAARALQAGDVPEALQHLQKALWDSHHHVFRSIADTVARHYGARA